MMPFNANILVVDPDTTRRDELVRKLGMSGYSTTPTDNADDAEAAVEVESFDMVIIETDFEKSGGFSISDARKIINRLKVRLRAMPEIYHLLTVIIGDLPDHTDPAIVLAAGADEFLPRPINDQLLMRCLAGFMRLSIMQEEFRRRLQTNETFGLEHEIDTSPVIVSETTRILILGKDEAQIKQLDNILGDWMDFICVWSPSSAIDQLNQHRFDACIVLADNQAADYKNFGRILRSHSNLYNLPLLALGDEKMLGDGADALQVGYNDMLAGSINGPLLLARLMALITQEQYRNRLKEAYSDKPDIKVTDALTELYSHGYFHAHLQQEVKDAVRQDKSLSVGFFSISGMEDVNQEHGYAAGDYLLHQIGNLIGRLLRGEDLAARYNGDEFAVILPGTSHDRAQIVIKRLTHVIEQTEFAIPGVDRPLKISIRATAVGLEAGESAKALLGRVRALTSTYSKTRFSGNRQVP